VTGGTVIFAGPRWLNPIARERRRHRNTPDHTAL